MERSGFRDRCGDKEQRQGGAGRRRDWETPGVTDQTTGRGQERHRPGCGESRVGEWTEIGSGERGAEPEAVTRPGVKTELGMRGRDSRPGRMCAPTPHPLPTPPGLWHQGALGPGGRGRGARVTAPRARCAGRSQPRGRAPTREAALSPRSLCAGSGAGVLTRRGASLRRLDSASVRQPRPLSCQQPVARATPRSSRPARTCRPSLGATQGPGSYARLGPFPVQARGDGHGRDRSRRDSCFGGHSGLGGRGRPCGMDLGPGTHSWRASSIAGRLTLQPPACLAAAGCVLCGRSPRVPMGIGVRRCLEASMNARGGRGGLGLLGVSAERTVRPRRHVLGASNPRASSARRAS